MVFIPPVKPIYTGDTVVKLGEMVAGTDYIDPRITGAVGYNYLHNGAFEVNQRAASSVTTSGGYAVDRWVTTATGSTFVTSQQAFTLGQTDVPGEPKNYLRCVVTTSAGVGNYCHISERVEYVRSLAGQSAVLSFYAKADAAKNVAVELVQNFGTTGSPSTEVTGISPTKVALTTSFVRYSVPVTIPSISGKTLGTDLNDYLGVIIWLDAGSNFNARTDTLGQQSGTFEFYGMKLESGTVATPFVNEGYAAELVKCQRYFQTILNKNAGGLNIGVWGQAIGVGSARMLKPLHPNMRAIPTLIATDSTIGNYRIGSANESASIPVTSMSVVYSSPEFLQFAAAVASGLVAGDAVFLYHINGSQNLELSAEL